MLELGWTRPELAAADPQDVEGLRWGLYARALEPVISHDIERLIADLERIDKPLNKTQAKAERRRLVEELRSAQRQQLRIRGLLELDAEEEDEPGG